MQKQNTFLMLLTVSLANTVYALTTNSESFIPRKGNGEVTSAPFINYIVSGDLFIKYDLTGKYLQKLVCIFDHPKRGVLRYTEDGVEKDSGLTLGSEEKKRGYQFYFTSIGEKWESLQGRDNLGQFHVDPKGYIWVTGSPIASCFYIQDDAKSSH